MTARPPRAIPVPDIPGAAEQTRIINDNFRKLRDLLDRAITAGDLIGTGQITLSMLAAAVKQLVGDVTGTIGSTGSTTVEKIRGKTVAVPAAGDDGQFARYNHGAGTITWEPPSSNALLDGSFHSDTVAASVAKGALVVGNATPKWDKLSVGSNDQVLTADSAQTLGVKWATLPSSSSHALLDGSVITDSVAVTVAKGKLVVGNATPKWDGLAVGTDTHVLTADSAQTLGVKWAAPSGGSTHNLLDGSTHPDTAAYTVARGSIIRGNATPKWDGLALGGAGKVLSSDGTDAAWAYDRNLRASRPTVVATYIGNGIITNNGVLARTAGGGTDADSADTARVSDKFTQDVNGGNTGSSWAKKVTGAMSPAFWGDFKIQGASKMLLELGFNSNGLSGGGYGTGDQFMLGWQDTDTNFRCIHGATGGAPTDSDTGVAKDANWHDVLVYTPDAGVTWKLEIDGVETNSHTTAIPTSSNTMNAVQGYACRTTGSSGNEVRFSYCVVQLAKSVTTR